MTNEEQVDIRITRTGKRKDNSVVEKILTDDRPFPTDGCMFEEDSRRSFESWVKKSPVELWKDEDQRYGSDLTYSQTLKPLLHDMQGVLQQRGQVRIRRYDKANEIVWVIQVDPHRAKFLDRIFMDFFAFLKRAFNAE